MVRSSEIDDYTMLFMFTSARKRNCQRNFSFITKGTELFPPASVFFTSKIKDGWGKKILQRLANDLKNEYTDIKGFSIRNMQCMMQFYNEYNKELTMCKMSTSAIAQLSVAQLSQEINVDVQPITQPSVAQLTNSNYKLGQALPKDLRSSLPSIEEIEEELESF